MNETGNSERARLVWITGLSGSGKSTVANCFEDLGYYVADNLPVPLLESFLADPVALSGGNDRIAVVADLRADGFAERGPELWRALDRSRLRPTMVFLDSADEALVRRFSESRRPHPLDSEVTVEEAIHRERKLLGQLRGTADLVLDTTDWSVHEMRRLIFQRFGHEAGHVPEMAVSLSSFGFKHGAPGGTDLLFDVRFLPNPYYVPELRPKGGRDPEVRAYLEVQEGYEELVGRLSDLLLFLLPRYRLENRSYLTVAIGCTGGQHRSVAVAERLAAALREAGWPVDLAHRDLAPEEPAE